MWLSFLGSRALFKRAISRRQRSGVLRPLFFPA